MCPPTLLGVVVGYRLGRVLNIYSRVSRLQRESQRFEPVITYNLLFMSTNINLSTTNSQYVSPNIFRNVLVGVNSIKNVFPLNLPRANTNYLFAFLDSHVIHYPTPVT